MSTSVADVPPAVAPDSGFVAGIPVRNLWLLMLYASRLYRNASCGLASAEESPDQLPDLVARILVGLVEKRLRRNLTAGYEPTTAIVSRVRGRIDLLRTERSQLLLHGKIACRFERLTVDTPRNRYVRGALAAGGRVAQDREVAHRCRAAATAFERAGVSHDVSTRAADAGRFTRHDSDDRAMTEAARLLLEMALPSEAGGNRPLVRPHRDIAWIRRLYEKAIAGFYDVNLSPRGWRVRAGRRLNWLIDARTPGIDALLPSMQTDVFLDPPGNGRRIVIDTKFTEVLSPARFGEATFRSGHLYQMYAYLRSQEERGSRQANANGLLLYPSIGRMIDETVVIQNHAIRFATVDLAASATTIRSQLLHFIAPWSAAGNL